MKHYMRKRRTGSVNVSKTPDGSTEAFIEYAIQHTGDECLIWPFARDGAGYGKAHVDGKPVGAHREVCRRVNGPPPFDNSEAAHACGNGHLGCVNKNHLRWDSHKGNHADRRAHGTNNAGENCGAAKLTVEDVTAIRELINEGQKQAFIAIAFGVSSSAIRHIARGTTWGHLP